jgi:hypothetical protein
VCRVCVLWYWPDLAGPPGLYLCVLGSKGSPLFVSKKKKKKRKCEGPLIGTYLCPQMVNNQMYAHVNSRFDCTYTIGNLVDYFSVGLSHIQTLKK